MIERPAKRFRRINLFQNKNIPDFSNVIQIRMTERELELK